MLSDEITSNKKPAHDGLKFEIPGDLMVRMSPLLYVFAKLLLIASEAGKLTGFPIPTIIPGIGNVYRDSFKLTQTVAAFERIASLGDKLGEASEMVESLQGMVDDDDGPKSADLSGSDDDQKTLKDVKNTMTSSYSAIENLLTGAAKDQWEEFVANEEMIKVYDIMENGTVHWVSKASGKFLHA